MIDTTRDRVELAKKYLKLGYDKSPHRNRVQMTVDMLYIINEFTSSGNKNKCRAHVLFSINGVASTKGYEILKDLKSGGYIDAIDERPQKAEGDIYKSRGRKPKSNGPGYPSGYTYVITEKGIKAIAELENMSNVLRDLIPFKKRGAEV